MLTVEVTSLCVLSGSLRDRISSLYTRKLLYLVIDLQKLQWHPSQMMEDEEENAIGKHDAEHFKTPDSSTSHGKKLMTLQCTAVTGIKLLSNVPRDTRGTRSKLKRFCGKKAKKEKYCNICDCWFVLCRSTSCEDVNKKMNVIHWIFL